MKPIVRKTIISFFLNGTIFTAIMVLFHQVQGEDVSIFRYAVQFVVIGCTMGYLTYRSMKQKENQE